MTEPVFAAGALKIKKMLPSGVKEHYDVTRHLDKGGVNDLMHKVITYGGSEAGDTITNLSNEFFGQATANGYSTPLADYYNDSEDRKTMLQEFKGKIDQINLRGDLSQQQKNDMINDMTNKYQPKMVDQNLNYLVDRNSTAAIMAKTKARGNPNQLQQATSSPLISKRIDGTPIPVAITSSYAEGLSPAEQLAMSYWGRGNTVSAQLSTSKPGAMFKQITPNVYHEVITEPDCGTKNGDSAKVSDKGKIMHRYEAGTNHLIDEEYWKELKSSGKTNITVRSTLTCEAPDGVCQKCYGMDSRAKVPDVGENVGVLAAQSASEVLTQMILSTKHDSKAGKRASPFDQVSNLLANPSTFKEKATIASLNGKVDEILRTSLNAHKIYINGQEHFVPREQEVLVKMGQQVKQGDALSTGTINPRELVELRGTGAGRKHITNTLREIYEGAGNKLDTRHYDLIAKNMVKHVLVENPGDTGYLPGQKVNVNVLQKELQEDVEELPLSAALGRMLSHGVLYMTPGTVLDQNHIDELELKGVDKVKVSKTNLSVKPLVPGLNSVKHLDENWISRLATGNQVRNLKESVVMGRESEISSTDPIAAYVMGGNFGDGKGGRY